MLQRINELSKSAIILLIAPIIIIADYVTKNLIVAQVDRFERIPVLPFLNIVHVENKGAAFGMFAGLGNLMFIAVAAIAVIVILIYLAKSPKGIETYALSLVLGGAVGNLIDRIRIGKVIDFIDVFVKDWHWPAFNVADSALTVGVGLFIIASFKSIKHTKDN